MAEKIVSLEAEDLEEVLGDLELTFSAQDVPTARRLRAAVLTEEFFCAARGVKDGTGLIRVSFPRPGAVILAYEAPDGAAVPDLRMVRRLGRYFSADGVNARFHEGRCAIMAG